MSVHVVVREKCRCGKRSPIPETKMILDGVSGVALPGQLLAIMGASGAGKTILMNALNGRNASSLIVEGNVCLNGQPVDHDAIVKVSGYVHQQDLFFETMTVREELVFQALLRMGEDVDRKSRMKRVEEVIEQMGLEKCANSLVGSTASGVSISGGQRKRLAFACEVLADPPLLFCDEPTSGLDSFTAETVVATMRQLANSGKTVVCIIHQPPSEIYEMFDKIYLLAEGRLAFTGTRDEALSFFESVGYTCPLRHNPPDYFMRVLAIHPGHLGDSQLRIAAICDAFESSSLWSESEAEGESDCGSPAVRYLLASTTAYKASCWVQFRALLWRSWINVRRQSLLVKVRFFQYLIFGLIIGMMYPQLKVDQTGVTDINGLMYFVLVFICTTSVLNVSVVFPLEFPTFKREWNSGMYRAPIYLFAKVLAELPAYILLPFMLSSIVYWIAGLEPSPVQFFIFTAVAVLTGNVATSFAYAVSCLIPTAALVQAIVQPTQHMFMLAGGFFHRLDSVPAYMSWLQSCSWYGYANQLLLVNQWSKVGDIDCGLATSNDTSLPCFRSGATILENYGANEVNILLNVGLLLSLFVGWQLIAIIFLQLRIKYT